MKPEGKSIWRRRKGDSGAWHWTDTAGTQQEVADCFSDCARIFGGDHDYVMTPVRFSMQMHFSAEQACFQEGN